MVRIIKVEDPGELLPLKRDYVAQALAPLDGMWLCGFVPMASHFGFWVDHEPAGYFCVNSEGYLLQFYAVPKYQQHASTWLESIIDGYEGPGEIQGAFASTAEAEYLSLCLDQFGQFRVNALMYQRDDREVEKSTLSLMPVVRERLPEAIEFAVQSVGAPEEWLQGYYANLVERQELYGVWKQDRLVGAGESRAYDDLQVGYADVGVIVAPTERGQGLATQILRQLVALNEEGGLKSICSTEKGNLAAQKAISRSGFFPRHRLIQFDRGD